MSDESAKRQSLAQRMSSLLGLPAAQIEQLIPLIEPADLDRLESMGDAEFLRESTKLINQAQRRQLDEMDRSASISQDVGMATAPPASENSTPKLRPLRKPGETGVVKPTSQGPSLPPGLSPPGAANQDATDTSNVPRGDMGGLRKVGGGGNIAAPSPAPPPAMGGGGDVEIDPLTGAPKAPPVAPRVGGGDMSFTPSGHSNVRPNEIDPEKSGSDAPAPVVAPAQKPQVREDGETSAEAKIPESFKGKTKKQASSKDKKKLMIFGGIGAVFALVVLVLGSMIVMTIFSSPEEDTTETAIIPPPPEDTPVEVAAATDTAEVAADVPTDSGEDALFGGGEDESPADTITNEDCLVVTNDFSSEIAIPGLLAEPGSFTIEVWVKVKDPIKVENVQIEGMGEETAFRLSCVQGAMTGLQTRFVGPDGAASVLAPPPSVGEWTHLAAEFDLKAANLLLYVNGELADESPLPGVAGKSIEGIRLTASVTQADGVLLIDTVRVSSGVRYGDSFTPERFLEQDDKTLAIIPMERNMGKGLVDFVSKTSATFSGAIWASLADDMAGEPLVKELILPQSVLDGFAADQGEEARDELLELWAQMSDEQKRQFLIDNNLMQ